ncbi:Anucleate primary sterigmata protein B [Arachnomyces sp. PD_36]|nr:Anucleate primary sterigmata protein B [Arachnomyces sp. PD_36]
MSSTRSRSPGTGSEGFPPILLGPSYSTERFQTEDEFSPSKTSSFPGGLPGHGASWSDDGAGWTLDNIKDSSRARQEQSFAQEAPSFAVHPPPSDAGRENAHQTAEDSSSFLPAQQREGEQDSELQLEPGNNTDSNLDSSTNNVVLDEGEMRRKLLDMESSFLPEVSTVALGQPVIDSGHDMDSNSQQREVNNSSPSRSQTNGRATQGGNNLNPQVGESSLNSPGAFYTPAPGREDSLNVDTTLSGDRDSVMVGDTTSALETMTSSPTAAAAARTISRVLSATSPTKYDPIADADDSTATGPHDNSQDDIDATPRRSARNPSPARWNTETAGSELDTQSSGSLSARRRKRPKFLTSRQSTNRFSYSSIASSGNTDAASGETTLGADYALQSGGALPANHSHSYQQLGRPKQNLSRSTSLGSMASGVSGMSDDQIFDKRTVSGVTDAGLHTLDEEEVAHQSRPGSSQQRPRHDESAPMTPKANPHHGSHTHNDPNNDIPLLPPDTVLAERVQKIQVPGTFERQYRDNDNNRGMSPDKRAGGVAPTPTPGFGRSGKTMTLKEQSSTIDRLSKENFDLKMRIHFLSEALDKRSEEGIKDMISENVELKSDKIRLQKDNQGLRRTVRELEKALRDRGEGNAENNGDDDDDTRAEAGSEVDGGEKRPSVDEEELVYLRERIETYEVEIEKLRSESITRETEKRRLAEMVKSLNDGRTVVGSETGAREERDMWKDMLDAETAAREQAEEQNRKLRDEIYRMKSEAPSTAGGASRVSRRGRLPSVASQSTATDRDIDRGGVTSATSSTLVEQLELLKHENTELRREVSAQTSMLTSRNREKERLYQEIEDLKLGQRRGDSRSVAGDSIFERSVSRAHARSASRASEGTRASRVSDAERENYETRNGELRDQVSSLKLDNQHLRSQLDEQMGQLEIVDRAYQDDIDQAEAELNTMQLERDHALQLAEEREADLQDLKDEAQDEIDALGEELDQKHDECQRLEVDLRNQEENLKALQAEMRSASEGIIRLEEDAQSNLQKYKAVKQELDESNREIESLEKSLFEANNKVQRLTVQQESSQNEIAFLREEQDGDKIKIGDLESEVKASQMSLQSEKDKTKDLEHRLADERHQHEVAGSKEKQEVQRIMNELNREASTAKEEVRKLKKNLSSREIEATTWRERLIELENSLREALGDLNGTRSSLLTSITKLQKELDSTVLELETTKTRLDETESLLQSRNTLLEDHGLEYRKLNELLDRERQARRADKHSFEQSLKSHQQASRTITQNNSRITDLEAARSQDRKRFATVEQQYKDQLNDRNAMFLSIWKRLSTLCGPDWVHSHSLINGNLPSQEVIGNMLFWPGFSKNLLLAVKAVENLISGFKTRIKNVERDLSKEYSTLEHNFGLRVKKLDRLEEAILNMRMEQHHHKHRPSASITSAPEISKLRGENRLLKAELNLLQSHNKARASTTSTGSPAQGERRHSSKPSTSNTTTTLVRHQSTSAVESSGNESGKTGIPQPTHYPSSSTLNTNKNNPNAGPGSHTTSHSYSGEPTQEKWIQRLRELERRLKAEREARLLDRSGARRRLEERSAENEELRQELERERLRKVGMAESNASSNPAPASSATSAGRRHENQSRSRGRSTGWGTGNARGVGNEDGTAEEGDDEAGEMFDSGESHRHHDGYDDYEYGDEGTGGTGTGDEDEYAGGLCVEVEV